MLLVEDEVGGEGALDTVRNNEPDLVANLEVPHLTARLGDDTWQGQGRSEVIISISQTDNLFHLGPE